MGHDMNASVPMPRGLVRGLMAAFVAFAIALFGLPGSPLGIAEAQSPTANPSGGSIQFLNPSGATANDTDSGPGREVSMFDDGSGQGYHLVAWVGRMPQNATADFDYREPDSTTYTPIGSGTLVGPDTFETFWNSNVPEDGEYEVRVILFSNGVAVARDEEAIIVNNTDAERDPVAETVPTSEDRGETVEIIYPTNAGSWGAFRQGGSSTGYVGAVDVTSSVGTNAVRAYYTTSAPGTEPTWTRCSAPDTGETRDNSLDGVRCTLAAGVNPASVTAVSAAAGDANQSVSARTCAPSGPAEPDCGEGEDSGDAHRTFSYAQVPSSMTLNPATQRVEDAAAEGTQFPCSAPVSATLLDQFGRKVLGANVDIHAAQPTDSLHFDDPDATGTHRAPDKAHAIESSANCEGTPPPAPPTLNESANQGQGEHEVQGQGDIKHIETAATGTNDAGALVFSLANVTGTPGVTQIAGFYDRNDDDLRCTTEPSADGAIGWSADTGTPTGLPTETTVCPEPTPTTTGSPSPAASRTVTGSPTPSQSPGTSRTVSLAASDAQVDAGDEVTLNGAVFSADETCEDNEFIRIRRRVHGTTEYEDFTSATTTTQGSFEVVIEANVNADYQAVATAHDQCTEGSSQAVTVLVKATVTMTVSDASPERGTRVVFKGRVRPDHDGSNVILQRRKGGRWVKVARDELSSRSTYRFAIRARWAQARVFRVRWPASDSDHEAGNSPSVRVRTHR